MPCTQVQVGLAIAICHSIHKIRNAELGRQLIACGYTRVLEPRKPGRRLDIGIVSDLV